ncbi:autotransporter domain-containing protein, partial [Fusobacterium varium]|nr:autotransporter domain-containing protein [Fusobacterium varium]
MIEKIMKAVKSSNKKRSRNITIGAVIGFLLSCTAVMGEDNYLWIKEDSGAIKFSTDSTTGDNGEWKTENPYSDNKWDKDTKTYTNNMILSSNRVDGNYGTNLSYGLRLSGELTDVNFVNNNSITGKVSSGSGDGYGIYNSAEMGNIKNAGEISGSGISGGYGIENKSGTIGGITNTGEISGSGIGNSNATGNGFGYGIDNSATMGNIENKGVISGTGKGASIGKGYGYGIDNSATMKNITNTGIISGTGIGDSRYSGEGYGIKNILGTMENITNTGLISGTGIGTSSSGDGEGYGINNYSTSTMGKITNTGVISGIGKDSSGNNKGYGISNGAGTIGDITNAGVISGIGTTTGTGIHNESYDKEMGKITNTGIISGTDYGIYNGSSSTMGAITNTGVIYGKDNAIKNDKDIHDNAGTITATNNYGILVTNGNSGVDGLTLSNNYGLIIKNEGENLDDITAGAEGTQNIAMEYDEDGKVIKSRSMTIKNETGSNSFDGNKENHILNALTNTYKAGGVDDKNDEAEVKGSIINAYGTAVVFEGENKQLTLSGTIVNGGIDEDDDPTSDAKVAAILGSSNGDTLILQSGKIEYTDNKVEKSATQNTIVNGNIDMGAGDDTLTIGDGTILNGTLDGGEGNDILNFGISSGAKSIPAKSQGVNIIHNI